MPQQSNRTPEGERALVAARTDQPPVRTDEACRLTRAAGYEVVDTFTQVRPPDPATNLGAGKISEIASRATETGAGLLLVDCELTPTQTTSIREELPDDIRVVDRYRLILDIFAEQAADRRANLQVELAQLRYDLPRIKAAVEGGLMNKSTERGSPVFDVEDRIDRLEQTLANLPSPADQFRKRRADEGFDLVTIAGYTNAGKSTLLHRLADDLSLAAATPNHPDESGTAEIEDRLFKTLDTTTRRATLHDRRVLLTDTVGFVRELPHRLIRSFSESLSEVSAADAVVLVADGDDGRSTFEEKLSVSRSVLIEQGVDPSDVIIALNKIDQRSPDAIAKRRRIATGYADHVVPISAHTGANISQLTVAIRDRLPTRRQTVQVPNENEAMGFVSWCYDRLAVESIEYEPSTVTMTVSGRPSQVEQATGRAARLGDS